jgi:putative ABC transport system substrate-binding protein
VGDQAQTGYIEGRNVAFEYRMAEYHFERLPALASDLVRRPVAVFFTAGNFLPAAAAKAATQAIPIVFMIGEDPVKSGLVASLARPGGNITGVAVLAAEVTLKRLALLHELVPATTTMAFLYNSANSSITEATSKGRTDAASRLGVRLLILAAANPSEIERAFATLSEQRVGALLVIADTFLPGPTRPDRRAGGSLSGSGILFAARVHRSGRTDELWDQLRRRLPPGRRLYWPNFEW